jgi:hypothetical protein
MKGHTKYQKLEAKSSGKRGKSTGFGGEGCGILKNQKLKVERLTVQAETSDGTKT